MLLSGVVCNEEIPIDKIEMRMAAFVVIYSYPWVKVILDNPALMVLVLLIEWSVWIFLNGLQVSTLVS